MKSEKTEAVITVYQGDSDFALGQLIGVNGWSRRGEVVAHKSLMNMQTFRAFFTRASQPAIDTDIRRLKGFGTRFKVEKYIGH